MLNAFYAGIKSVSKSDKVLTGGTAPYGDLPGGARVPPATFWQTLLCLRGHALRKAACPDPAHFDIDLDFDHMACVGIGQSVSLPLDSGFQSRLKIGREGKSGCPAQDLGHFTEPHAPIATAYPNAAAS